MGSKYDDDPDWIDWQINFGKTEGESKDMSEKYENLKKLAGVDNVNHPNHYNREDAMECIDEMVLIFGKEATMNFCLCNAWKYRYRAADKNGEEDLRKSDWYINKYKELKDGYVTTSAVCNPYIVNNYPDITLTPATIPTHTQDVQYVDYGKLPFYGFTTTATAVNT